MPERVIPTVLLDHPQPSEARRQLLLRASDAVVVATERDLLNYFRLDAVDSKLHLSDLVEAGELLPVRVESWKAHAYCRGQLCIPRQVKTSALLLPFDSLIWERERTERLFGFRHPLEIYTPPAKRVDGYYVLPFLHHERLLARVDLRSERAHGRLAVHAVHLEETVLSGVALHALRGSCKRWHSGWGWPRWC